MSCSWILKGILKFRSLIAQSDVWERILIGDRYKTKLVYDELRGAKPNVSWKNLMYGVVVRPRAQVVMWLACHGRLATKDRLCRFGILQDRDCCFLHTA